MIAFLLRVAAVVVFCLAAASVSFGDVPPLALGLALFAASFLPWGQLSALGPMPPHSQ